MTSRAHVLSDETQVTLLLCGHLLASRQKGGHPLSPGELNKLARELQRHGATLPDLLQPGSAALLQTLSLELDHARIHALLGRGFLLSLALEKWSALGLWVVGRSDDHYPKRFSERLQQHAPPLLYGCGDPSLLEQGGVAIVGSRDIDASASSFTASLAELAASENIVVISGGARGVDQDAMRSAAENSGRVVGIVANDLVRAVTSSKARDLLRDQRVVLASPFDPEAGFNVGNAMARNKMIYALADFGVVVSSGKGEGGTWSGAIEQLQKFRHIPVFVRSGENTPEGNIALIQSGAIPLPSLPAKKLHAFLQEQARNHSTQTTPVEQILNL